MHELQISVYHIQIKTELFLCSQLLRTMREMSLLVHKSNKYLHDNVFDLIKSLFFEKNVKLFFYY